MHHAEPAAQRPMIPAPFLVAHRAANRLEALRAPVAPSTLLEADLRLRRGRIEVRHLKQLGPLPVLWDKWFLARGWGNRLTLSELLREAPNNLELMLDLKGRNPRLASLVRETVEPELDRLSLTICARSWKLLDAFAGLPVRRFGSVGNRRGLHRLERTSTERIDGVSIHERLLTPRSRRSSPAWA